MKDVANIDNAASFTKSGLLPGDTVHLRVVGGQLRDDVKFVKEFLLDERPVGVILVVDGREGKYYWGDIIELWKIS